MKGRKIKTHVGLDVGTSKIVVVVAAENEEGAVDIIGAAIAPCASMR